MAATSSLVGTTRTVPSIRNQKVSRGGEPLVMVTAYDSPGARFANEADVDMILVGDSLAMVVLGYDDTLSVTVSDMAHHTAAVARAKPQALIVADLPWMSYHLDAHDAVKNSAELIRAGGEAVKLEGGKQRVPMVSAIINAEIPVMGHVGLTPQSVHAMGGFKVQARESEAAQQLLEDCLALEAAGCFSIVLEGVPTEVASYVTRELSIPTIGIGAGPHCDGQVLVYHDLLGIEDRISPKFVRRFADVRTASVEGITAYAEHVRGGTFPSDDESYHLNAEQAEQLALYGSSAETGADTPQ